jgi:hypothetical protein
MRTRFSSMSRMLGSSFSRNCASNSPAGSHIVHTRKFTARSARASSHPPASRSSSCVVSNQNTELPSLPCNNLTI